MSSHVSAAIFPYRRAKAHARVRLVCLPHAGGNAALYREWDARLGGDAGDVEVCAVELPGRGRRFRDEPWTDVEHAVREIAAALAALPPLPVAIFGHSLGARLAFALVARAGVKPIVLLAAAAPAPHLTPRGGMADLPRDELVRELAELGGTPREVLENEEMMELLLPMLRADLRLAAWGAGADERVECPVTVLWGRHDQGVSRAEAEAWSAHTAGRMSLVEIDGGHFFVSERLDAVIANVREAIGVP